MKKTKDRKIKRDNQSIEGLSLSGFFSDAMKQIGIEKPKEEKHGGDLTEGQELSLADINAFKEEQKTKEETAKFLGIEEGFDYKREILGSENLQRESREISKTVQEILFELKQLAASSKELQTEFKDVIMEQRIENPGKYHMTFFSFVLTLIRTARERIEDAGIWLSASKGKAAKKGYWGMAKKYGESFFLSNERTVATQVG